MPLHPNSITCILALAFISHTNAQQSNNIPGQPLFTIVPHAIVIDNTAVAVSPPYAINIKAVRDFAKSFKDAENVRWYIVPDGFMAYFTEHGIKARAGYDKKGNWLYCMRSYAEACLPKEIRAQVKSIYYDCTITWVNEITYGRQPIYIVHILDGTCWKNIRIWEGEMEIVDAFEKE